jgi:probable blue pigment (indigoidine) exporter
VTGWTFLFAGLTLLPVTLIIEGLPRHLTARNVAGLIYLVVISGIVAYAIWFWGLERLSASAVTFLTLLNPVTAACWAGSCWTSGSTPGRSSALC